MRESATRSNVETDVCNATTPTIGDVELVSFLQWALPQLQMRWPGFRKVRRRVRKRIRRRMMELGLSRLEDYRAVLETTPPEWSVLDEACRIPISRFYRDRSVFDCLRDNVLPELAGQAVAAGDGDLLCWSAGCAGGEEPYTLALIWHLAVQHRFPGICFGVRATDSDAVSLERARVGCYGKSSLIDLPDGWCQRGFNTVVDQYCIQEPMRSSIRFRQQDIRRELPDEQFDIVLCRNLVLTYFDEPLQVEVLERITSRIRVGGYLVIGKHERLPERIDLRFDGIPHLQVFRRVT